MVLHQEPEGALGSRDAPPTWADAHIAAKCLPRECVRTPLIWSSSLGVGLKLESTQPTGSFKVRGAFNAMRSLPTGTRVVTVSAGNHALGVAYAAMRLRLDATVVLPSLASPTKIRALRQFPCHVMLHGETYEEAREHALALARSGYHYISPYNDARVVAGQGTIGLEIMEQLPQTRSIVCPIGGGGLISGIALAVERYRELSVIGVESEASPTMQAAIAHGRIVHVPTAPTIADGLAANLEPDSMTVGIVERLVESIVTVTETETIAGIQHLFDEGMVTEGAAAVGVAAILAGRISAPRPVVVVVSGRNIDRAVLISALSDS